MLRRPPILSPSAPGLLCALATGAVLWAAAAPARAAGFEEFQKAREAYEEQDYQTAAERFEALVGGEVIRLNDPGLVEEAHKLLAATYVYLGQEKQAAEHFEALLEERPDYPLDPHNFPPEVHAVFNSVRERLERERREREAEARREAQREAKRQAEIALRQQEQLQRLRELATEQVVEHENSRWIAALPFGIGQFQNGDEGLGTALAVSEGLLVAATVGTAIWHASLRSGAEDGGPPGLGPPQPSPAPSEVATGQRRARAARYTNWVSFGLLGAVAIAGIIDAQVRFVPVTREVRHRELPEDVQRQLEELEQSPEPPPEPEPEAALGVWPGGASLRVTF